MSTLQVWRTTFPRPGATAAVARAAEAEGWDGLTVTDSQNITGDPYAALCLAAQVTEQLRLGTGVTNPVTRHPAVTASSIATVQVESRGRAVLGIGRGDSALANVGQAPAPLGVFESYVTRVQGYLRGEYVELDGCRSRLEWLSSLGLPKVPVNVTATGPRVIELGARLAEWVTFTVGADRERLAGAVATAREARRQARLDPALLSLGAYVNVAVHPDVVVARDLVRGVVGAFAHFSGMRGAPTQLLRHEDRIVVERLGQEYDMAHHGMGQAGHAHLLDDAFVDRFAVVGPPDRCIERLRELVALGLDHLIITVGGREADSPDRQVSHELLVREVLPALKAAG
jgi:5,10-methylenetetrahydromethanopterin reductase